MPQAMGTISSRTVRSGQQRVQCSWPSCTLSTADGRMSAQTVAHTLFHLLTKAEFS